LEEFGEAYKSDLISLGGPLFKEDQHDTVKISGLSEQHSDFIL